MSPLFFAVAVGLGLGLLLYVLSGPPEEERCYTNEERCSTRRSSTVSGFSDWGEECSICLNTMKISNMIQLPCTHLFHTNCILQWRREGPEAAHQSCPNCRGAFTNSDFGLPE